MIRSNNPLPLIKRKIPHVPKEERSQLNEGVEFRKKGFLEIIESPESKKTFIGIDNGVTGAITILSNENDIMLHEKTPVTKCLNYTKKKAFVNRVNFREFKKFLRNAGNNTFCFIERPMIDPKRWPATVSAIRCLEATMIILEELEIPYQFIDSKEWQKELLPSGLVKDELKTAADSVAKRLFPKQKIVNADSILIAEYCLRKNTGRTLKK
jgi:hypothetical protein